jgi:hypothetical protein
MLGIDSSGDFKLPKVIQVVPNSPAAVSLKEGMYILMVNGSSCRDKSIQDVVAMIRGEIGTHVILSVADNKPGNNAAAKDMVRIILPQAQDNGNNTDAFYTWCENEVKQIHKQRHVIIKTFNSECGNYFFNFNADTGYYHIQAYALQSKDNADKSPVFGGYIKVYDNSKEASATNLQNGTATDGGNFARCVMQGGIDFRKPGVGVINTHVVETNGAQKCQGMYIVVYK